jgi:hypothetical protein
MSIRAAVGTSSARVARDAGREAAREALSGLAGEPVTLVQVHATTAHDQQAVLDGAHEVLGEAPMLGCSGEGVISQRGSDEGSHAVGVMAVAGTGVGFRAFECLDYGSDPARCGLELAQELGDLGVADPKALIVLPDGLVGNCSAFLNALHENLPFPLVIAGGTAADMMSFDRTHQYHDWRAHSGAVVGALIGGDVSVDVAVSHGCTPIGQRREVTRSEGGWVKEIDGRPAWDVFKEYLDGNPRELNADGIVHLCIGEPLAGQEAREYDEHVIRTPLQLDERDGSLLFPGGLPAGRVIQITRRDPERIRRSATSCAAALRARHRAPPALVLQFDCAGRGRILFGSRATDEIVRPLQDALGRSTPWLGFHTYGEIAPILSRPYFHNYTVALLALYPGRDGPSAGAPEPGTRVER